MTPAERLDRIGRAAYWIVVLGILAYANRETIRTKVRSSLDHRAARLAAVRLAREQFDRRMAFLRSTYSADGAHDGMATDGG